MNQHFQKAQLIAHTRPDVAVRELHAALAEEPDLAMAHSLLSMCFLDLGRTNDAFESARNAVSLDPQDGFSFYALARCHLHKAEFIEAEVAIDEALELEPFDESYLWLLALVQSHIGEFKEAKETLDRALECNPEHASSHSLRAYVLNRLDEKIESDKSSQLALSLTPDDAWSHNFRGWALIERKAYHEAMPHFREALRIDPTLSLARDGLIMTAPSQHWLFKLHLKLKNKSMFLIIPAWLIANFVLHVSSDHKSISALLAIYLSWFGLLSYLLVLFLPDSFISGPVLRFLLQFEQDGRYILSDEERRQNNHLVLFIVAIVASLALAIINQFWWPLGIALFMF
ncbi:MAG: tetratricopeptide repeat protein, partial [Candidatus Obscuribacterales bacterium]|nr:tetratricopeptide repeat protein [Candidatus Obscuribacterales bacterium]